MNFRFIISLALFFFLKFLSNHCHNTEAAPTYLQDYCPNTTLFAPNSTYQSNLNALLSSLSSAATNNADGFTNATATAGKDAPHHAYGLFLCRGDISTATCSECVATGIKDILQRCPDRRISVIWYDECMLKYSDRSIYSLVEIVPGYTMSDTGNVTDPDRFVQLLGETMNEVAGRASGSESAKKFAVAEVNFTSSQKLYTLAQCTPDLTGSDCNTCLRAAIADLPQGERGGRSFTPSCVVRFEMYPFYNASAVPPLPQLPSPPAPLNRGKGKSNKSTTIIVAVAIPVGVAIILLFVACCLARSKTTKTYEVVQAEGGASEITTAESLQYHLATIQAATNNFSHRNKLGQGGFGEVFQGRLPNGQEIAVKRLSKSSGQGVGEFKNEVVLVAKLQHRNLVRLLGFCIEGEEKILVYEFVLNKSLDYFLFDPDKRRQLDWSRRYNIISGIARGMLYLHEDSRLRIIHRDLKPSNVLLDSDMNPKISDFGMARIFGVDQTRVNTNKIVGTFGYLSPEYAMHGQISAKSDVYSFGVLILEIISGKKNSCFYHSDGGENLTSYAWKHWRAGTPLEVLDPFIGNSYSIDEVLRCLHIGLLGVQEDPADRPTMASIVLMLSSHSVKLPQPQQPAFFLRRSTERQLKEIKSDESTSTSMPWSTNEMSVTEPYPR